MPAAFRAMNSPLARGLAAWISRATISLPEPGGPEIRSRLLAEATLTIRCRSCWAAAEQPIGLERLFQKVVGPALDRADGGFDVAVPGNHHHREIRIQRLD